jgi:hypothetical protein
MHTIVRWVKRAYELASVVQFFGSLGAGVVLAVIGSDLSHLTLGWQIVLAVGIFFIVVAIALAAIQRLADSRQTSKSESELPTKSTVIRVRDSKRVTNIGNVGYGTDSVVDAKNVSDLTNVGNRVLRTPEGSRRSQRHGSSE